MSAQLYRHFDVDWKLLYVGVSKSAIARLAQHGTKSHWSNQIAHVEIAFFDTREEALAAERQAIIAECPLYNILLRSKNNAPAIHIGPPAEVVDLTNPPIVIWPRALQNRYGIDSATRRRWETDGILPPRNFRLPTARFEPECSGWKRATADRLPAVIDGHARNFEVYP